MAKPASKTKKTFQANLGSLAKADTTGKKRSASSKTLLLQSATNKRRVNFLLFVADWSSNVFDEADLFFPVVSALARLPRDRKSVV